MDSPYSVDQLFGKLERADAAGDTEAAKVIADEIRRLQGAPSAPRHRRGSRGGATMAGSLSTPNVAGKNVAPAPKGNAVTRALGEVGGRQVLQGAYGLYGALGGDALNEYVLSPLDRTLFPAEKNVAGLIKGKQPQQRHFFGIGNQTYRDAAAAQADEWGMRKPQTAGERVVSDIGEGLTGTALTMGLGGLMNLGKQSVQSAVPSIRSKLAQFLTANPGTQAISTATGTGAASAAREQGASPLVQLAAGIGGGLAPPLATTTASAATRGLVRGSDGAGVQRQLDKFAALGATPSVGQTVGGRGIQGIENLLAASPTAEGIMSRFATQQSDDIGRGLERTAESLSRNPSAENAGRAIETGTAAFKKNVNAMRKALYWQVDKEIPRGTSVRVPATWQRLVDLTSPTQGAPASTAGLVNPTLLKLRQNLEQDLATGQGQIPYEALKRIRTDIGERMEAGLLQPDTPTAQLSKIYAALSQDMEAAARAQGPRAAAAAQRANTYTRASAQRLEQLQRIIDKNGGPEKVYQAAFNGARDGGTTIRAVMRSLDQQSQKAVTAATIRRMGLANPGAQDAAGDVFSAQTFLTNWNKVSPEAKRALFDRYGMGFSSDMDRIAKVAETIRDGSSVYRNPAGTGNRVAAIGYWVALGSALASGNFKTASWLAGAGVSTAALARTMTDPKVVRWLANTTRYPSGSLASQLQTLRQIGRSQEDEDILALADALEEQVGNE